MVKGITFGDLEELFKTRVIQIIKEYEKSKLEVKPNYAYKQVTFRQLTMKKRKKSPKKKQGVKIQSKKKV